MSLALEHKRRILALGPDANGAGTDLAYSASTALGSPAKAQKHLKLMKIALDLDLERLSDIKSLDTRQQLKRDELLPKYMDYVERYRDSGLNYPNPVLTQVVVWLFDTLQFELGLEVAQFAMAQNQQMPPRFKRRDLQTFVADAVIDWAEAEHKAKRSPEPYVSGLLPFVDGEWDLFEGITARYHKVIGIQAIETQDWAKAIEHFERAVELYPEIGVGTRLAGARRALEKRPKQTVTPATE